jgi:hypothetical protein
LAPRDNSTNTKPDPNRYPAPGSGIVVTVTVPANVLVTVPDPPGANAASMVWKGALNPDVKTPFQLLRPSLVTPLKTNCAVD